jgi:trimethylamine--corrinoid protein Co-methyltransferase
VLEILERDEIEAIHETSMRILSEVGVEFSDIRCVEIFKKQGIRTEDLKVFLTETQIMAALEATPQRFVIHARNPERNVTVGDGNLVFAPGYGAPFIIDVERGKRNATLKDYDQLVKLVHTLPNQDMSGHLLVEPSDIPPESAHLQMLYAQMNHSDKPLIGSVRGRKGIADTMQMVQILFGPNVEQKAVIMGVVNSLSPLGYSPEMSDAIIDYARERQPLIISALAMAGSTAPITMSGLLAMQNAELLAGITLAQLVSPGTPVIYGSTSTSIDMRTGALTLGSPELAQLVVAHNQLARLYGLPSRSGGALTDSHSLDQQAGYQSMMGLVSAVYSGADFILHAAGILSSYLAISPEKLIIDDDMCGMVRRFQRGFIINKNELAFDVIAEIGSQGCYLTHNHTRTRYRDALWKSEIETRVDLETWMETGRPDVLDGVKRRKQGLLDAHEDPPIDRIIKTQLKSYVDQQLKV